MTTTKRKPKSEHWETKRNEILLAAGSLFIKKGFAGTSMSEIARVSKVDKATLYYYFEKKMSILYELAMGAIKGISAMATPIADSTMAADDKLRLLVEEHIKWQISNLGIAGVGVIERGNLTPKLLRTYIESRGAYEDVFLRVIQAGMLQGHFRSMDPKVATLFALGFVNSVVQWFKPGGRLTSEEIASQAAEFVVEALIGSHKHVAPCVAGHLAADKATAMPT